MPSIINSDNGSVSGSAGLKSSADSSGVLALQTNGTTALSISAAQVVTLTNALPVASGGSGVTTSTGTGANVLGTTPSFTSTIGVGGATASASGSGVSFPATQSASSDVNTLDDYEEGTWTPATAPSSSGTANLKNISAYYTKVGRVVNAWFTAQINTVSSPVGRLGVSGLPFAANTSPIGATALINGFSAFSGSTGALIESGTTANIDIYVSGSISSNLANFAATNGYIFFNATYTT